MAAGVVPKEPYSDKVNAIDKSIQGKNAWLKGDTADLRTTVLNAWTAKDHHQHLVRAYKSANADYDQWCREITAFQEEQDANEKP